MALTPTVLTDAYILLGANVLADHSNKVEIAATVVDLDTTAFGQTWMNRVGGLKDGAINIDFFNDYVATFLDSILWPLLGTNQTIEIRPTSAGRGTGNPAYTGTVLIGDLKPIGGSVGTLSTASLSWKTSGAVLRQTS